MTTDAPGGSTPDAIVSSSPLGRRWRTPIVIWAAGGTVALLVQTAIFARWIGAGSFHSAPHDFDISSSRAAIIWIEQALAVLAIVLCVIVAWRQSRRERNISWHTAIIIGSTFTFWLGGVFSTWDRIYAVANRYALNVNSWAPYVPGWHGPQPERQIETILAAQTLMYVPLILWMWAQLFLLRYVLKWRPSWRIPRLVFSVIITGLVVDTLIEAPFIRTGAYAWLGANWDLSLFGGHWYQLPLVAIVAGGLIMAGVPTLTQLLAERKGRTVHIFRGGELFAKRPHVWLRALAGVGFMNAVIAAYWIFVPLASTALGVDPLPPDTPAWLWRAH